ncbi:MAG: hypothetical protein ACHQFX_07515 [Chitinophagales bacterium]
MKIVPKQHKGAKSVTRYSIKLPSISSAKSLFQNARMNLLNVNAWHVIAGPGSAIFEVFSTNGQKINGTVKKGNYLRITIPIIPGSPAGRGADWVRVEKINEEEKQNYQITAMSVRPAPAPITDETEVAHFFSPDSTSTFSIERNNKIVIASVNGRNETPNTKTKSFWAGIRNLLVALGAMIGLNKSQWKKLAKGLIKKRL